MKKIVIDAMIALNDRKILTTILQE